MNKSYLTAGAIALALVAYFGLRMTIGAVAVEDTAQEEIEDEQLFSVRAHAVRAEMWGDRLVLRGRTEAERKVTVRAETSGLIVETPVPQGAAVVAGDALCRIAVDSRAAELDEAQAAVEQRRLEHDAAKQLHEKGYRSETALKGAKAAYDSAMAQLEQARLAVEKTSVAAPFDGLFDRRMVEVGDLVGPGDACGVVIQTNPFLVVGNAAERVVHKVKVGATGRTRLATGEVIEGVVRFVSKEADPGTRTFRVELEIPNDGSLRDGVTADIVVAAGETRAHLIQSSSVILNDEGVFGVRYVDDQDTVRFSEINILEDTAEGVWVAGLPERARIITVGQYYVRDGEQVEIADGSREVARQ